MIIVTATLASNAVTITPTLATDLISVTPSVFALVNITASLSDSTISVAPTLSESEVETEADIYTSVRVYSGDVEYYTSDYEFTPTTETQTIDIGGLLATADITINPIPSNYGLITWDGATLTVS